MKSLVLLSFLLVSTSAFASGGFTWLGGLAHSLHIPEHVVTFLLTSVIFLVGGIVFKLKTM